MPFDFKFAADVSARWRLAGNPEMVAVDSLTGERFAVDEVALDARPTVEQVEGGQDESVSGSVEGSGIGGERFSPIAERPVEDAGNNGDGGTGADSTDLPAAGEQALVAGELPAANDAERPASVLEEGGEATGGPEAEVTVKAGRYDESKHPRASDGKFGHGGGSPQASKPKAGKPKPASGKRAGRVAEKVPSEKAERAKAAHVMVDKDIQRYAEEHNEPWIAKKLRGLSLPDGEPVDVMVPGQDGKVAHGLEVKTMVKNGNMKLTMDKYAQVRKVDWEQRQKAKFHTVVMDDHAVFNANGDGEHDVSKRVYYYRRGCAGSARVATMHKCKDLAEVKRLMEMPEAELPDAAKRTDGKLMVGKWKPLPEKEGRGYRNTETNEVAKPKK